MFEMRWVYVRSPVPGDIFAGGNSGGIWQRLQYRCKDMTVDEPFDHKNDWSEWRDVPLGSIDPPPLQR